MNKHALIPLVSGIVLALTVLACGSGTTTTTKVYPATNAPTGLASSSKNSKPTATPEPQISLEPGNYTSYTDIINSLWFVGEVVNTGNASAQDVQVAISLLDDSGNVVGVGSDTLTFVQANGKFPFKILVDPAPKTWKDVKFQIQGQPYDPQGFFPPYIDLKVDKVTGQASSYGSYELNGTVINTGQKTATLVHIVAIAYDKDGKVLDVGDTFSTLNDIAPGGDSPFSLDFGHIKKAPASYEIYAVSSLTK